MSVIERPDRLGFSDSRLQQVNRWLTLQVDSERLAGASVLVGRRGKQALFAAAGWADVERRVAFSDETVVRIYSMTKPITTVAAMMLYELGCFELDDPISRFIPAFADTPVWAGAGHPIGATVAADHTPTVRELMTHTAGFTYGFMRTTPVDAAYRAAGLELPGAGDDDSLDQWVQRLATIPLLCQPGSAWNYSVATDVLGRLVEIWSGRSLTDYFAEAIFEPLAMTETGFSVAPSLAGRLAACYAPKSGKTLGSVASTTSASKPAITGYKLQESAATSPFLQPARVYSGGGGLTGTVGDYARFCQMLLNGGELDGQRLLGPRTVSYMRRNHLPDNRDMAAMGQPQWSETSYQGIGFGLGFAVVLDPVQAAMLTNAGEHHWGGAASTFFWIDPAEDLYVILFAQLMPSSTYPLRRELRTRIYQALVD